MQNNMVCFSPLFLLVILGVEASINSNENPGALIQANIRGLNYAKEVGIEVLNKRLSGFKIPDAKDGGFFAYSFTNFLIRKVNVENKNAQIKLSPPDNINVQISGLYADVEGDYSVGIGWGWFSIGKNGHAKATISGAAVTQGLALKEVDGKPQVVPTSSSLDLGDLEVDFGGGLMNKMLESLVWALERLLTYVIRKEVQKVISGLANEELRGIPTSIEIAKGFNIDYSLTSAPKTSTASFVGPMLARVWFKDHHDDPGIPGASAMAPMPDHHEMFCVQLEASSIVGSLGYAAQASGIMHYTVDSAVFEKYHLRSEILDCKCKYLSCIGKMIPEVVETCKGGEIQIHMTSSSPPVAKVNSTGAFVALYGDLEFEAVHEDESVSDLFTAHIAVSAIIPSSLRFEGWKIKGEMHIQDATVTVKSSKIGPVDQRGLDFLWQTAVMVAVEGELNRVTENGFQLPDIPFVKVLQPKLEFGDKMLKLCFDGAYTGPRKS